MLRHMDGKEVIGDGQHGSTKSRLCLTNETMTALMDKETATDIISLDLCEEFDTVPHDILVL